MQTYLGLDIGTYSIKAVVLRISFDNYSIEEMIEQEISLSPEKDEKTAKIEALKTILSTLKNKVFDSVYASLGCQFTVMKRFDLNNIKRADRQKIIESEFDLLGLFNLDEYSMEYHTIKFDKVYAKLLAILIQKSSAKLLIDIFAQCELNVRIIDIDNLVFLNLISFLPSIENSHSRGVELFLDIGHSKTSFIVIENNKVINTRVFNIAGMHLTNLIKNELALSYEEAKNLKHDIQSQSNHKNYLAVQNIIESFFEEICSEIKRTIKSINATEFVKLNRVFITGGSSKFENIRQILEKNLEIEPINITLLSQKLKFNDKSDIDFKTFSQALGVVFRSDLNPVNSKINLRHGDLSFVSNYEKIIHELSKYAKLVSIFIIVLLGTYTLRSFLFNQRITEMKTQYLKEIMKIFSNEPKELRLISSKRNWDFNEYNHRALKIIQDNKEEKSALISTLSINNTPVPLNLLEQISLTIPKNIYFEVVNFKYQDDILFFEADTDNSQSVEDIVTRLKNIKILTQVVKKSEVNKAGSDGRLVHFSVSANVSIKGE